MIKRAAVLVVALAMSSCSTIGGTGGEGPSKAATPLPREQGEGPSKAPTPLPREQYDFELVSLKADPDHDVMGTFRFRHTRWRRIHLWGHGFEDEKGNPTDDSNTFRVRFETFKRKEEGRWVDVPVYSCGFASEEFAIRPNRDYSFMIPLWLFVEKGTHGIVILTGTGVEVESTPFETAEIQKIAASK